MMAVMVYGRKQAELKVGKTTETSGVSITGFLGDGEFDYSKFSQFGEMQLPIDYYILPSLIDSAVSNMQ